MSEKFFVYSTCKNCKGSGCISNPMLSKWDFGYLAQKLNKDLKLICPECNGMGSIKKRIYKDE